MFFFFNDTATTEIYTLSLHDALPISPSRSATPSTRRARGCFEPDHAPVAQQGRAGRRARRDRKSTRLNSSHANISYAVFCLKKKKQHNTPAFFRHAPHHCDLRLAQAL